MGGRQKGYETVIELAASEVWSLTIVMTHWQLMDDGASSSSKTNAKTANGQEYVQFLMPSFFSAPTQTYYGRRREKRETGSRFDF